MRKQLPFKASFCLLFISCFAASASYCQLAPTASSGNQQEFLKAYFNYLPDTKIAPTNSSDINKKSGEIVSLPYLLLSDSLVLLAMRSNDVISYIIINNNDPVSINDSINIFSNDADSLDKEANTNGFSLPEIMTGKDLKTGSHGTINLPPDLADTKIDRLITKYAEMVSLEPEDVKNYPLYKFINDWYGVKYKWGGNDISGIDCSAFSQRLYGKIYSTTIHRTARQQHRSSEKIKDYSEATEGDLVFFRVHHIRISHVGVYLANGYFVHASRSRGVMISSLDDPYWRSRYAGCGKIAKQERAATESDFVQEP